MAEGERKGTFRAALAHRDYRRLALAMVISMGGDWLYNVAYLVFIYQQTHSAAWLGAATLMRLAPYVLFGSIAGTVADRFDKKSVMIACDLLRVVFMALLALDTVAFHSPLAAIVLAFASTAAGAAFNPSAASLIPRLVGEEDLAAANAVRSTIESTAIVVGPAVGSVLLLIGSNTAAFAINAGTFAVSALAVSAISGHAPPVKVPSQQGMLARLLEGARALRQSSTALMLVGFGCSVSFLYGLTTVFFILIARQYLGKGGRDFGYS